MKILCIIPVRGGSKGLPRKNALAIVKGVSLLEWTIRQANLIYPKEDVFVSTEDNELRGIAQSTGAQVLDRPAYLAGDETTTSDVVRDILLHLDPESELFDAICILQVTSPLRLPEDIAESVRMIKSGAYDSVISAFEATDCHPAKLYFLKNEETKTVAVPVAPMMQYSRRQDLTKTYRRNGAIFVVTRSYFSKTGNLWGGCTGLVIMPKDRSVDIDTAYDLTVARNSIRS